MRIGFGYDVHRLAGGRNLYLGGVEMDYPRGLVGHSDGDVLVHAIIDALLGAAGLGDIGEQFPDTAEEYRDISSLKLLEKTLAMVGDAGYGIVNLDTTIVAEAPRISPWKEKIRTRIASVVGIDVRSVGVKAKTNEGVGEVGQGEAIAAYAVALLEKK